nr:hypothetical protein Iba_chr01cCG14320 [Ipomoea batatas]GMC54243.1 hypothetical protein Iba_chr01dCG14320 [Ipomoea batatas]
MAKIIKSLPCLMREIDRKSEKPMDQQAIGGREKERRECLVPKARRFEEISDDDEYVFPTRKSEPSVICIAGSYLAPIKTTSGCVHSFVLGMADDIQ